MDPLASDDHVPRGIRIASSWLAGAMILAVLHFPLLPPALSALLVFELVHTLAPRLTRRTPSTRTRIAAVGVLSVVVAVAVAGAIFGIVVFARSDAGSLPALLSRMAEILEN